MGLALARVSPRVSCLGEKCDCERQLTGSSAQSAASLAWWLEDKGKKSSQKRMIWELKIRKTNKTRSQNFFNWEHRKTGEGASSSWVRVLINFF